MTEESARALVTGLVALLERKALEPDVALRLKGTRARRITVLIFEKTAGLRLTEIKHPSGRVDRVRLPDPEIVRGQAVFAYDVNIGGGEFRAIPTTLDKITDGAMLFTSGPVLASLIVGAVQTPGGPLPYDAGRSFQAGDTDWIGADPGDFLELLGVFEDLIAASRAELGIGPPAARAGGSGEPQPAPAAPDSNGPEASMPQDAPW